MNYFLVHVHMANYFKVCENITFMPVYTFD